MSIVVYPEESYRILGACFEVYKDKGAGFLEAVYQECLTIEFRMQDIPAVPQRELGLSYKGEPLRTRYVPDFLCFDRIIVEIKAVNAIAAEHRAQLHNYLRAGSFRLGLLVNFGHSPKLEHERIVL